MTDKNKEDVLNHGMERKRVRQRRPIKSTAGFKQHGLIEQSPYTPPDVYPSDARDYLEGLSRCGTMTGAAAIAGITTTRVYEWRKQLEGFEDEEDTAKYCFTDVLEADLFKCGLGLDPRVQGVARVNALDRAIKANRPEKYNDNVDVNVDAEVTWLDIVREHSADIEEEESEE